MGKRPTLFRTCADPMLGTPYSDVVMKKDSGKHFCWVCEAKFETNGSRFHPVSSHWSDDCRICVVFLPNGPSGIE